MHGGAITLARRFLAAKARPDVILATDMLDLTTFLALTRPQTAVIPTILYMHENQLTYPLPADGRTGPMRRQLGERDQHYAFINIASMLAANHVFFNSHYHLESFFDVLPNFLKHFPEYNELSCAKRARYCPLASIFSAWRWERVCGNQIVSRLFCGTSAGNMTKILRRFLRRCTLRQRQGIHLKWRFVDNSTGNGRPFSTKRSTN